MIYIFCISYFKKLFKEKKTNLGGKQIYLFTKSTDDTKMTVNILDYFILKVEKMGQN